LAITGRCSSDCLIDHATVNWAESQVLEGEGPGAPSRFPAGMTGKKSKCALDGFGGFCFALGEHLLDALQSLPCALFVFAQAESYVGVAVSPECMPQPVLGRAAKNPGGLRGSSGNSRFPEGMTERKARTKVNATAMPAFLRFRCSYSVGVVFVDFLEELGKGEIDGRVGDLKPLLAHPVAVAPIPAGARLWVHDP